jgi:mannose-6-phosphate isomerase-like protein (cupin superfamily)
MDTKDFGPNPYVVNIEDITKGNDKFRVTKWTGKFLQMTLMAIPVGGEIGLERHDDTDQFLRVESGEAKVMMGNDETELNEVFSASDDFVVLVPAGKWHNLINVGEESLKVYSLYAPPEHKHSTVHETYVEAMEAEHHH